MIKPRLSSVVLAILALGILGASPIQLLAQAPELLRQGTVTEGALGWESPSTYRFDAESAGVLTVVARSGEEADLFLLVTDADGQPVPNGRSDQDLGGDSGAEQFAVTLPRSGEYHIRVEAYGGSGTAFKIGVSWLPFPDLSVPPDPDGSPSSAVRIRVGQEPLEDALDGTAGDYWDWFVMEATASGTITVATRSEEGDLILEAFSSGEFSEPLERSDQDLQESGGNEALTLMVEPGQEVYFKVSAFSEGAVIPYRLQIGFMQE
jgi:hypothetical protein